MKKDRFKINPVTNFIVEQDSKILLLYRDDGFFEGGYWVLPGGHIDGNETARQAAARELKEEVNIDVTEDDLKFVHVTHNLGHTLERFDFFFKVTNFEGELKNNEPDKCKDMQLFAYDALPPREKMADTTLLALEGIKTKEFYSERGFDKGYQGFSDLDKFTFDGLYNATKKYIEDQNTESVVTDIKAELDKNELDIGKITLLLSSLAQLQDTNLKELLYKEVLAVKQ